MKEKKKWTWVEERDLFLDVILKILCFFFFFVFGFFFNQRKKSTPSLQIYPILPLGLQFLVSYLPLRTCALPWFLETQLVSLLAQSISVRWWEETSKNITPVWAISPHMPAAALYSSNRTWMLWLTQIMLVKYAVSMPSVPVCEDLCQS